MIALDRRHMAELLEERMNRSDAALRDKQKLDRDASLVKTYLIEANLPEDAPVDAAFKLANGILPHLHGPRPAVVSIARSKNESSLVTINTTARSEPVTAYLDFTNPRFWILHSMSDSRAIDWLVKHWITEHQELDRTWFPADLLEEVSNLGSLRGLGLDYDRRPIPDVDLESVEAPAELLKMQLWGSKAPRILQTMRGPGGFPHQVTLSKVKVRYQNGSPGEFCVDDVKYDGKITARGTSFAEHLAFTTHIYRRYSSQIRMLEADYAIKGRVADDRVAIDGTPINFVFDPPIANLAKFCDAVFSASLPFRLWGVPTRLGGDSYRVHAVDLHSGHRISFELIPELIRVYLPAGTCGNAVLRFYTNLQHHYDALVRVVNSDGEPVFEFQPSNAQPVDRPL